jgi:hypothetical protein
VNIGMGIVNQTELYYSERFKPPSCESIWETLLFDLYV